MNNSIKLFLKHLFFGIIGGFIYWGLEMISRGYSHWTMFILGGVCYVLIGLINEIFPWDMYIEFQCIIGGVAVTVLEFIFGCVLNLWLGLEIWNYANVPGNILGQVCLPYTFLWMGLALIAILLDDQIRYRFFNEEKPKYISFIKNVMSST